MKQMETPQFRKGDLVKRRAAGGHVMTVLAVSKDGMQVTASYITLPDQERHDETWQTAELKRVVAGA